MQICLEDQQGLPVLFHYIADATSLLCMSRESRANFNSVVAIRKGKALHGLPLQRGTFMSFEPERTVAHLVVPPGSAMQAGGLGNILLLHLISHAI